MSQTKNRVSWERSKGEINGAYITYSAFVLPRRFLDVVLSRTAGTDEEVVGSGQLRLLRKAHDDSVLNRDEKQILV